MENTLIEATKASKTKGSWENILNELKKHFTLQPNVDMKFAPPRKNELLSSIEIRLNRYRGEIIVKGQTEKV
jgi:hypothetical protein